jgi:uncharacterized protein
MILRKKLEEIRQGLREQAAVALLGPRQAGKTTLALAMGEEAGAAYLDLESVGDRAKLADAADYLGAHEGRLVILDEIHRVPDLFPVLRGLIDAGRRKGLRSGRFLLLGSGSMELMRQSGESLAGRIRYLELTPLQVGEVDAKQLDRLWVRGGFPESFLAETDRSSLAWREDLIRTYLERDIPQLGPRIPAETLRRFWTMLAHGQGGLHNAARIAAGLELSGQTVGRYTDLLVDLLLVRRLQPYLANVGKRLVKSPKVYIRDSGLLHALLNLGGRDELLGHPVVGGSWEGFVIENLLAAAPARAVAGFYRSTGGAEIDLVMELPGGERWAVEIKRQAGARPERGFHHACLDLRPARSFLVSAHSERYPLKNGVEAIGLRELAAELELLGN